MPSVSRDELQKVLTKTTLTSQQRALAELRLQYSNIAKLKTDYLEAVRTVERIYPTILPTQASGRWSYINPALSNFPKKCINPACSRLEHEKTVACYSLRDCIIPDDNTFWIEHDLDAVEHRIYCLILDWKERIDELKTGKDPHTKVTCELFNLPYPSNPYNPHSSKDDEIWRERVKWRGKDDTRRTMSKNFTYGGQYFYVSLVKEGTRVRLPFRISDRLKYNPAFVYSIPNIQSYLIEDELGNLVPPKYEDLAVRFVESNVEIQSKKAVLMEKYRKDKVSRTLYGSKRQAWFRDQDSAKALFNHTIQGTVASYIDESCVLLQKAFPTSYLIHNQHDSLKWAHYYSSTSVEGKRAEEQQVLEYHKKICQRMLRVGENELLISATFHIVNSEGKI